MRKLHDIEDCMKLGGEELHCHKRQRYMAIFI